ncbi:hypothetical protein MMC12_007949, partial [Toensbergia leucococca]|nr:hypothetical protein [Toensbergia leucococca]
MPASTRKRKGPKDKKQNERSGMNKKPRPSKSIVEKNGGKRGLSPVNYTDVEKTANEYKPDIETLLGPSAMTVDDTFFWPD